MAYFQTRPIGPKDHTRPGKCWGVRTDMLANAPKHSNDALKEASIERMQEKAPEFVNKFAGEYARNIRKGRGEHSVGASNFGQRLGFGPGAPAISQATLTGKVVPIIPAHGMPPVPVACGKPPRRLKSLSESQLAACAGDASDRKTKREADEALRLAHRDLVTIIHSDNYPIERRKDGIAPRKKSIQPEALDNTAEPDGFKGLGGRCVFQTHKGVHRVEGFGTLDGTVATGPLPVAVAPAAPHIAKDGVPEPGIRRGRRTKFPEGTFSFQDDTQISKQTISAH